MDTELYWKWVVRCGIGLLLLLANALLVMLIVNLSDMFDAIDRIGEAADSLKTTAATLDVLAEDVGEDVERATSAFEQVGKDASAAKDVLTQAGEEITRATDALEDAQADFGRIADTLQAAYSQ